MHTNTFVITFMVLISVLVMTFSSCERVKQVVTPEASTPDVAASVKIGVIQPSRIAVSFTKGAELAKTQLNNRGGVLGRQVEFLIRDNQGERARPDAAESVHLARELIEQEGVVAMLGPVFSSNSLEVGPVVTQLQRPMIPTSSGHNVTAVGGEFVFLVATPSSVQGRILARLAFDDAEVGAKTAATVRQTNDAYSESVSQSFEANFQKLGGKIVGSEVYQLGDTTFDAQLTNIKAESPGVVFAASFNPEVPLLIAQARSIGIEATFIGGNGWDEAEKLLGTLPDNTPLEGAYFFRDFSAEAPNAAPFVEAYTVMFGVPPDGTAAWGYDAMLLLATAMENAGTLKPTAVRDALANIADYRGASAIAGYDADRHPLKSSAIHIIRNGQIELYKVFEP